jgi:hypothetical protein
MGRPAWLLRVLIPLALLVSPLQGRDRSTPVKPAPQADPPELTTIVYKVIANEWQTHKKLQEYSPRVETYLQYYQPDLELGDVTKQDDYFLGRLKFDSGRLQIAPQAKEASFLPDPTANEKLRIHPDLLKTRLRTGEFAAESLVVDPDNFDRKQYSFVPVRWEYLGDLRCLVMEVHPLDPQRPGAFIGRIWVEDHDYAIVRINGERVHPLHWNYSAHFDCWRENLQPGLWLPVYIYSQENDLGKRLRYKAETRLWGYDLTGRQQQQSWTNILVDAPAPVRDESEQASDLSPVESQRQLTIDAERNVLERLEKARLIAPAGPVDKVLETVVNNIRATNHLDSIPPIQCRVMLTSSLESFSLAYTIVLSRGLLDVLPDEASLAMVLAHEVAHISLGHKLDTQFAFADRIQISDEELLQVMDFTRCHADEEAADAKGVQFLKNSPYKDNLAKAGLFLRAAADANQHVPHLFGAHLGNGLTEGNNKMMRMAELLSVSPELSRKNIDQIAALPLGSRIVVDAWGGTVAFTTRKAVPIVDASEKMPFRLTPVVPYLRPYAESSKTAVAAVVKSTSN